MINCTYEAYIKSEEIRKNKIWKAMSKSQRHMALMYVYRLLTDMENINSYIETQRFHQTELFPGDLPDFVFYSKPHQLLEMAYDEIGERRPA